MNTQNTIINHVSDYIRMIESDTEGYLNEQNFLYRGEGDVKYKLLPSVYRTYQNCDSEYKMYLEKGTEQGIIQQFMTEATSYINHSIEDRFTWVEYAQHYGVPTRLLDWTKNPLVALYFSCISTLDYSEKFPDGRVYRLNNSIYNQIIGRDDINKMDKKIIKVEAEKMIWDKEKTFPYPMVFRPYYFDRRMLAQSSCFMVWGHKTKPLDELINELENNGKGSVLREKKTGKNEYSVVSYEDTALISYTIPGDSRLRLLSELDKIGINSATLFPGIDGIGSSVERRMNIKYEDNHLF